MLGIKKGSSSIGYNIDDRCVRLMYFVFSIKVDFPIIFKMKAQYFVDNRTCSSKLLDKDFKFSWEEYRFSPRELTLDKQGSSKIKIDLCPLIRPKKKYLDPHQIYFFKFSIISLRASDDVETKSILTTASTNP